MCILGNFGSGLSQVSFLRHPPRILFGSFRSRRRNCDRHCSCDSPLNGYLNPCPRSHLSPSFTASSNPGETLPFPFCENSSWVWSVSCPFRTGPKFMVQIQNIVEGISGWSSCFRVFRCVSICILITSEQRKTTKLNYLHRFLIPSEQPCVFTRKIHPFYCPNTSFVDGYIRKVGRGSVKT